MRPSSSRCQYRVGMVYGSDRLMSEAMARDPRDQATAALRVRHRPPARSRTGPVKARGHGGRRRMKLLGIDIGGSGVKGAVVDTRKGVFATDRLRLETPQPGTPEA